MNRKVSMIGRHLIRIKVLQTLYAYKKAEEPDFQVFYKELEFSFKKSYEQYLMFFLLLMELKSYSERRISQIQERQIKDEAAWQRLQRLAANRVLAQLENNSELSSLILNEKISIENYRAAFKEIFNTVVGSELYGDYIAGEDSYAADKNFVRTVLLNIVAETESLFDSFEEHSIFWNDDVDNVISMVDKTLKNFDEKIDGGAELLPMFADAATHDFGYTLFTKAVSLWDEINPYIDKSLTNWKQERVAEMDIIIMQLGITEMMVFPEIPIPVSMNEYIELAKWYSTQNSGQFVNGIMYKVIEELKKEGKIKKIGRGLIEKQ
ncbi:MAG: transcription antitermination protein NusB [Bacteroidales bacterium]|nr:transcription antitermination protein NusB [Bacteroidales bacterium]MBR7035741.1 transcription antitermination protein NusB [Bacteroidales bacterium]